MTLRFALFRRRIRPFPSFFKFEFEGPNSCKPFSADIALLAYIWVDVMPFDFYHRESLFTIFEDVEEDALLDDFMISLRIAQKGYFIAYTPNAYAEETASLNVKEELKRK